MTDSFAIGAGPCTSEYSSSQWITAHSCNEPKPATCHFAQREKLARQEAIARGEKSVQKKPITHFREWQVGERPGRQGTPPLLLRAPRGADANGCYLIGRLSAGK